MFPPATYKIISGNVNTCTPGLTINGYGATLDVTAASAPVFTINVGGSVVSTAPATLVEGFHVTGTQTNTSTYFLRVDNVYSVTIRDVSTVGTNLAFLGGADFYGLIDNCTVASGDNIAVVYTQASYPAAQQPYSSHIDKLNCSNTSICIEADAGSVYIVNTVLDTFATGVHVAGGIVTFRDGSINIRVSATFGSTLRAFLIDSLPTSTGQTGVVNFARLAERVRSVSVAS